MVSIIYAYRNREVSRIKASLDSLQIQNLPFFKVIFVDYGSEENLASEIQKVVESYSFASYYYIHASSLLWNKSKALNYGIKMAITPYIFIADVDLIFSPKTIDLFQRIANLNTVHLFKLGYLDQKVSEQIKESYHFDSLTPKHFGTVNGMILASKEAFEKVHGYDTFFHFYGSEDVDLYQRMANYGYEIRNREESFFYHNWHTIYNTYNDEKMSLTPRLYNVKRINEQHYLSHKNSNCILPNNQNEFGTVIAKVEQDVLLYPTQTIVLENIHAHVHHFFYGQLPDYKNEVICIVVQEAVYYKSIKHVLKKILRKQSQPFMSMKAANDVILTKILYEYKDANYAYQIANDLKKITFTIQL
jgi:glycosyltransferase involved in cell wall biosynthesis